MRSRTATMRPASQASAPSQTFEITLKTDASALRRLPRSGVVILSIEKIDALVAGISRDEIQRMPPVHRQRLAQALRYVADLCDPPTKAAEPPKAALTT